MRFLRKKTPDLDNDLRRLEKKLRETLIPVLPRIEFVRELGVKLAQKEIKTIQRFQISKSVSNGLLVAGGVIGSIIMIATSIRGLISIVGIIGYLVRFLNRDTQQQPA